VVISDLPGEIHEVTAKRISLGLNGWRVEHPDSSGRFLLSTLRVQPHGCPRMTRGHDETAIPFM